MQEEVGFEGRLLQKGEVKVSDCVICDGLFQFNIMQFLMDSDEVSMALLWGIYDAGR